MFKELTLITDNLIPLVLTFMVISLIIQYHWLNTLNQSVKKMAILLVVLLITLAVGLLYLNFPKGEVSPLVSLLVAILGLIAAGNILAFPTSLAIRKIVHYHRLTNFKRLLKKTVLDINPKGLGKLTRALNRFNSLYDLDDKEAQQLQTIYKQVRNHREIPKAEQMTFAQVLIISGVANIDLPRTYDINVDVLSSMESVLQVAYSGLKEAKKIVDIAPNASLCACRKYTENLTKYLIAHHKLQVDVQVTEDNFSTLLHVLNQSGVIKDKQIIRKLYQIKEVGNDAAHNQMCDVKTARDMFDEAILIESWFRKHYK